MDDIKRVTVRLPVEMWKGLMDLKTDGRIKSIHQALIDGANDILWIYRPKQPKKRETK